MAREQAIVRYQSTPDGGRLVYYADTADEAYWDAAWDRDAEMDYSRYEAGHLPAYLRRTFLRHVRPGGRVLEAGCGTGWFTIAAKSLGYQAEGIDYAPRVIARLKERFPDACFSVGDVRALSDTPDGAYDAVFSPGVCEHFPEGPDAVLSEAHRVLRPGGILLVSAPCFNPLRRLLARLGRFRGSQPGAPFYQYAYSVREMTAILDRLGFDVIATDLHGVIATLDDHLPGARRLPGPVRNVLAKGLEALPPMRAAAGHSAIWVARKR